jgi:hypothetical protein
MRTEAEIDAALLAGAEKLHNGIARASQGFKEMLQAIDERIHEVHRVGDEGSVDDFLAHFGPDRVRTDVVGLMVAAGLGDVLVKAAGRKDWKPEPDFYQRVESLVNSGILAETRGPPNPDPLSGYEVPGVKWLSR